MYENLRGKAISFEGGEGAGKSTIMKMLAEVLEKDGLDIVVTREPGGNKISEQIREVIVDKENTSICNETECLLYAASRAQLITENIKPLLATNKTILFARFVDSSYVYQGFVRGLGVERVKEINEFATNGFMPNVTILFDIEPELGFKRIAENNRSTNRLDLEGLDFHRQVRRGYKMIADLYPNRIKVIDASKTPDEVLEEVLNILKTI